MLVKLARDENFNIKIKEKKHSNFDMFYWISFHRVLSW